MAEQFDSNPTPKPVEEDDWEKDEFEESLANGSTAVPTSVGAVTRENPSFEILKSGKGSDSGDQQKRLQEPPQTVTSGKILPTPTIRLMQRPKEARIPIAEANKPVGRSTDTWDDEEWDANRSGGTSNSKIWDEANVAATTVMPAIPSHIPALPSSAALRILRRPSPSVPGSSPASSGTSTPAGSKTSGSSQSGQSKTLRTLSEREEEYRKARERIFGPEVEGSDVAASEASDADGVVTATSSPSSITKMLGATEPASMVPRCSNSATSSVTSSTSTSSVGVSRRQNSSQVQQQTLPTNSRSASANSNGRSNRGTKRNGKGESTFEPLRPPREQQIQYQQQQLLQQHQQQQYYMQQQQYQMQLQLNGYAQSGYVGPAPAYGANMALGGMNQGPGFIPYAPSQYSQNSMQAQPATAGPAMYPNRHINPSLPMNPPNNNNVLRQPAGPDDMGSLGFGDLRIHDHHQQHRYSTGVAGAGAAPLQSEQRLTTGYNQYPPQSHNVGSHLATNPHTSAGGPGDPTASRATLTGQPSFLGATTPSPHAGYGNSNYGGARPAQQDSTLWPPLVHTSGVSSGGMTPAPGSLSLSSSEIGRKGPQHSVWRP